MNETTVSRRDVFKLIAAASAAGAMRPPGMYAQEPVPASPGTAGTARKPTFSDPDFQNPALLWEKPLTPGELGTLTVLCDIIIPGDDLAPPPSQIGIAEFINEWVGAPYPQNREDFAVIRGGLAWLDTRCNILHSKPFRDLVPNQQTLVLDGICDPRNSPPEAAPGLRFFLKLRMLVLGGYYSHSKTWKSLGYVGNIPIAGPYPGVPDEIIKLLGLEGG